jgi:hypothetical protein
VQKWAANDQKSTKTATQSKIQIEISKNIETITLHEKKNKIRMTSRVKESE